MQKKGEERDAICLECGVWISFTEKFTKICSNCSSPNFLVEKKYALLKYVASGGFGSIYKALNLGNNKIYALKIRLSDKQEKLDAWNEEIRIHQSIQTIPGLLLPKYSNYFYFL